jgi:hypothetical protein
MSEAEPAEGELEAAPSGNCRRSCFVLTLLLSALLAASGYSLQATRAQRVANAVAEVEAAGLKVSGLNPTPEGPNGADDLRAAAAVLDKALPDDVLMMTGVDPVTLSKALKDPSSDDGAITYVQELPTSPPTIKKALGLLVRTVDQIEPQILEGLSKEVVWAADFEQKGFEADSGVQVQSELTGAVMVRAGARMLAGESSGAYEDVLLCLALAKTCRTPTILGRLIRNARIGQVVFLLEGLLALGPPPAADQLSQILSVLRAFEGDYSLTRPLLGELHGGRLLPERPNLEQFAPQDRGLRGRLLYGSWRASFVELLAECVLASRKTPQEFQLFLGSLSKEEAAGPFCEGLVTSLPQFEAKNRRSLAELRVGIRALELLSGGEDFPESLGDMPYDPCVHDQRRCSYRLDADRVVIWSVGPDGIDQAGVPAHESDGASDDIAFRLPRRKP